MNEESHQIRALIIGFFEFNSLNLILSSGSFSFASKKLRNYEGREIRACNLCFILLNV